MPIAFTDFGSVGDKSHLLNKRIYAVGPYNADRNPRRTVEASSASEYIHVNETETFSI